MPKSKSISIHQVKAGLFLVHLSEKKRLILAGCSHELPVNTQMRLSEPLIKTSSFSTNVLQDVYQYLGSGPLAVDIEYHSQYSPSFLFYQTSCDTAQSHKHHSHNTECLWEICELYLKMGCRWKYQ